MLSMAFTVTVDSASALEIHPTQQQILLFSTGDRSGVSSEMQLVLISPTVGCVDVQPWLHGPEVMAHSTAVLPTVDGHSASVVLDASRSVGGTFEVCIRPCVDPAFPQCSRYYSSTHETKQVVKVVAPPLRVATSMQLAPVSKPGFQQLESAASGDMGRVGAWLELQLIGENFQAGDLLRIISVDQSFCDSLSTSTPGVREMCLAFVFSSSCFFFSVSLSGDSCVGHSIFFLRLHSVT